MTVSPAQRSPGIADHELEWLLTLAATFQNSQRPLGNPLVLLGGSGSCRSSFLATRLQGLGCVCEFVFSFVEACSQWERQRFDLVLTPLELSDGSSFPLISRLAGAAVTLFYCVPVENSCWWLPAIRNGRICFGSPALLPSEFMSVLEDVIEEIGLEGKKKDFAPVDPPVPAVLPPQPKRPTVITALRQRAG